MIVLTNSNEKWKPGDASGEEKAKDILLKDWTAYRFEKQESRGKRIIQLFCVPARIQETLVSLPRKGFLKLIKCQFPIKGIH